MIPETLGVLGQQCVTYSHLHVFLTNMAECLFSVAAFSSHVLRVLPMGARLRQASSD